MEDMKEIKGLGKIKIWGRGKQKRKEVNRRKSFYWGKLNQRG